MGMLRMLKHIIGTRCVFPLYHVVSDFYMPHVDQVYRITSREEFIADIDFLLKHFKPVTMQELLHNPDTIHKRNQVHFTFDDGLREMHDVVVPILLSKGIPATFFLNPSFIDNMDLFYRYKISLLVNEFQNRKISGGSFMRLKELLDVPKVTSRTLKKKLLRSKENNQLLIHGIAEAMEVNFDKFLQMKRPYLSSVQIDSMIKNGFTMGAHSMDHSYYPLLSTEEQIEQTDESIRYIVNQFHVSYRLFAFPFTDHRVGKAFFDYFYRDQPLMDFSFGTAGLKDDCYVRNIQRIPVEDFKNAEHAITREYLEYIVKKTAGLHKIKR